MQAKQAHAEALAMSMDHHRILAHSRQAVARRLLSSLPSAPQHNVRTENQDLRAKTIEPSVPLPQRRPAPLAALAVLAQLKSQENAHTELYELGDCIAHPETACNCVKVKIMGQSPATAWSMLGRRFKARHCSSACAPPSCARHRRSSCLDFDSSKHPSESPLSSATTEAASSPQETSTPLFTRCTSDPPRLLSPLVSASKERHVHRRASDTSAQDNTAFALRRLRSEPIRATKPRDESTAPTRVSSTDDSPAPTRVKHTLKPVRASIGATPPQRITRGDTLSSSAPAARSASAEAPIAPSAGRARAEAPIAPSAFVAQLRQKCEKLLPSPDAALRLPPAPERKPDRVVLGVPRAAKRFAGVPSAPKSN